MNGSGDSCQDLPSEKKEKNFLSRSRCMGNKGKEIPSTVETVMSQWLSVAPYWFKKSEKYKKNKEKEEMMGND